MMLIRCVIPDGIYILRGLRRCSFRQEGRCQSLSCGTSDRSDSHAFYILALNNEYYHPSLESQGFKGQNMEHHLLNPKTAGILLLFSFVIFIIGGGTIWYIKGFSYLLSYGNFVGGVIACLIAIANAILLYSTLMQQKGDIERQKVSFKQERFETTFFNLWNIIREL